MIARFTNASFVANATCGVAIRFFACKRGWSFATGGSFSKTSTAAPAIFPSFNASANALLSTTGPLDVFMRTAFGFMSAISFSLIRPFVEAFNGTCSEIISQVDKSSSKSTYCTPVRSLTVLEYA